MTFVPADGTPQQSTAFLGDTDLTSTVRYLASLKNVSLTPEDSAALARTTDESFTAWNRQLAHGDARQISALTIKAVDRTLDVVAALRVMRLVAQMIEGNPQPDNSELTKRATAMVDQFIGETNGSMHRWPEPYETFRAHYGSVPWGPIHHTLPDGTVTIGYFLNEVAHRDPKEGPAFECRKDDWSYTKYSVHGQMHRDYREGPAVIQLSSSQPWFRCEEYYERGVLHRPASAGPAVIWTDKAGNPILEIYYEHGALHRDPQQGPAWHRINELGERSEYYVNGKLHRDHRDGPAIIDSNFMGKGLSVVEYWEDGRAHRTATEGPACFAIDQAGQIMAEIYAEHGELHRDPKQGPARYFKDDRGEEWEYAVRGKRHRDSADDPALIYAYADGKPVRGESYYSDDQRHRPASEGPALRWFDAEGKCVRELYAENGVRHRDPKQGPAWSGLEDGLEKSEYQVNGQFHRDEVDGPAIIYRDTATGTVVLEEFYRDGKLHRTNGPARIERDKARDIVVSEEYHVNGIMQRDEVAGPSFITRDPATGTVLTECYYRNGELHRTHGPASLAFNEAGRITVEYWYVNGKPHRDPKEGPAEYQLLATYHETFKPVTDANGETHDELVECRAEWTEASSTQFYFHGELHRDPKDGPAVIEHDSAGRIVREEYWVDGVEIETPVPTAGNRAARRKSKARKGNGLKRSRPVTVAEPHHA